MPTMLDTYGVGPSSTRVLKEPKDWRGRKDNPKREDAKENLKQICIYIQEVNS
jgi:hypothetical protein